MKVLGVNAIFHDQSAALVVDGEIVAAVEEERLSRRKHGKRPVAFAAWELPELAMRACLAIGGIDVSQLDAVAYSYDPALVADETGDEWESLRTMYARGAPLSLAAELPGLDAGCVRFVAHHVAHAASGYHAAGWGSCAVLVLDGRGERASHLAGVWRDGRLETLTAQELPASLGLLYEDLTSHLGFLRSSDEYKVMAMASYGRPEYLGVLRGALRTDAAGGFTLLPVAFAELAPPLSGGQAWTPAHADLACSVQRRLEELLLEHAAWLASVTGERRLAYAGGVALNCVANARLHREGPFDEIFIQPAAGDAGTALGAALHVAHELGDAVAPMRTAALGRAWNDDELAAWLSDAALPYERPDDLAGSVADVLANNGVVAWFQGRAEFGPRALGHRSLMADPRRRENLERLNKVKGREQFRPVAPMVLVDRAAEIFTGRLPSEHMLFTHDVRAEWRPRIPAVVHVDGTARVQTVDPKREPRVAGLLAAFAARTGVPVLINTSLNTAGRPMADDPRDALECFGSAPVDMLVLGPYLVRRQTDVCLSHGHRSRG